MEDPFKQFNDSMAKAGYKEGQQLFAFEGKTVLSTIEQKVVDKIMSIREEIGKRRESIETLRKEIDVLDKKLAEWQSLCPHTSKKIEFGPQGDKICAEIKKAYCCICYQDLTAEVLAEKK